MARYYVLTLVFHDQAKRINDIVGRYEASLVRSNLPNIPFHSSPLLNGHEQYARFSLPQRKTSMTEYRLEQVADYLCTIELAAIKYRAGEDGGTYNKFFGGIGAFKKNWLKQARRKHMR